MLKSFSFQWIFLLLFFIGSSFGFLSDGWSGPKAKSVGLLSLAHDGDSRALNISVARGLGISGLGLKLKMNLTEQLLDALTLIESLASPPPEQHFFRWGEDRNTLEGKSFQIYMTTASDFPQEVRSVLKRPGSPLDKNTTTVQVGVETNGNLQITTFLIMDRIFFDETGTPRRDSFQRLALILASQIFAGVQYRLERIIVSISAGEDSWDNRKIYLEPFKVDGLILAASRDEQDAVRALETRISFLERWRSSAQFEDYDEGQRSILETTLESDRRLLRIWKITSQHHRQCRALHE